MSAEREVLIVGAGPTGLTLGLWLARLGVAVRIIDKNAGPGETSRALAVLARTLEYHRQVGIIDDVLEAGVKIARLTVRTPTGVVTRLPLDTFGGDGDTASDGAGPEDSSGSAESSSDGGGDSGGGGGDGGGD